MSTLVCKRNTFNISDERTQTKQWYQDCLLTVPQSWQFLVSWLKTRHWMTLTTLKVQLNWHNLQKDRIEKTILLKNLLSLTFEVLNLRRLGFCFLLSLSCQVKVIRHMVQFKESYKDKFDQLHHMQAIGHVLISLLLQYFNAKHVQHKLDLLTSRPERMIGNSQDLLVKLLLLSVHCAPKLDWVCSPYLEWAYFKTGFATASQHVGIGMCWIKHVTTTH